MRNRPAKRKLRAKTPVGAYDNYLAMRDRLRREGNALVAAYTGPINHAIWPTYVTVPDARKPAGIAVLVFNDRQQADAAGFDWIGRIASR